MEIRANINLEQMETPLYKKTEKFVTDTFTKAEKPTDVYHAQRTAYWIKELKPDADEALLIAGLAHDIERAFYGDTKKSVDNVESVKKHQEQSAKEIGKFLEKENAPKDFIKDVKFLVAHHEEGGNEKQNILCDADCLAYFEEKALRNAKEHKAQGKPKADFQKKIDHVFSRISSEKAKEIAQPFYDRAIKEIN